MQIHTRSLITSTVGSMEEEHLVRDDYIVGKGHFVSVIICILFSCHVNFGIRYLPILQIRGKETGKNYHLFCKNLFFNIFFFFTKQMILILSTSILFTSDFHISTMVFNVPPKYIKKSNLLPISHTITPSTECTIPSFHHSRQKYRRFPPGFSRKGQKSPSKFPIGDFRKLETLL